MEGKLGKDMMIFQKKKCKLDIQHGSVAHFKDRLGKYMMLMLKN